MNEFLGNRQSAALDVPAGAVTGEYAADNNLLHQSAWGGAPQPDRDLQEHAFVQASFGLPLGLLSALPAILSGGSIGLMPTGYPMGYERGRYHHYMPRQGYMIAPPGYQSYPAAPQAQPYAGDVAAAGTYPATAPPALDVRTNVAAPTLAEIGVRPAATGNVSIVYASSVMSKVNNWCWDPDRGWTKGGAPASMSTIPRAGDSYGAAHTNNGMWAQIDGQWVRVGGNNDGTQATPAALNGDQTLPLGYGNYPPASTSYDGALDPNLIGVDPNSSLYPPSSYYGLNNGYDYGLSSGYGYTDGYPYDYPYGYVNNGYGMPVGNTFAPVRTSTTSYPRAQTTSTTGQQVTGTGTSQSSVVPQSTAASPTPQTSRTAQTVPSRPAAPTAQTSELANLRTQAEAARVAAAASARAQAEAAHAAALARVQAEAPKPKTG